MSAIINKWYGLICKVESINFKNKEHEQNIKCMVKKKHADRRP